MGDGEAEAFPAGLVERGPQCVSVLEGVPHPAWSCLEHLVVSLVVARVTSAHDPSPMVMEVTVGLRLWSGRP
jgi:hypothetical protein